MKPLHPNTLAAIQRWHENGFAAAQIAKEFGLLVPEVKRLTRKPRKSRAGRSQTSRREIDKLRPPNLTDDEWAACVAASF